MSDVAVLNEASRDLSHPIVRPRDAATLIVIDRSGPTPKVLMGRRHDSHKFMPGKFVFPGGRVEPGDGRMATAGDLIPDVQSRLMLRTQRPSAAKARALALAAIRETCEETGLLLGQKGATAPTIPSESWRLFADASLHPDLGCMHFVARAITPPGRNKRFDTRFFTADAQAIGHRIEGIVGPTTELVELVWVPIDDARQLDIPAITQVALEELQRRTEAGLRPDLPVPFFRMVRGKFVRETL